jgi:hypothetical protein
VPWRAPKPCSYDLASTRCVACCLTILEPARPVFFEGVAEFQLRVLRSYEFHYSTSLGGIFVLLCYRGVFWIMSLGVAYVSTNAFCVFLQVAGHLFEGARKLP